eukprot:1370012-Amorphochlora_amoeboformis.AAC.1
MFGELKAYVWRIESQRKYARICVRVRIVPFGHWDDNPRMGLYELHMPAHLSALLVHLDLLLGSVDATVRPCTRDLQPGAHLGPRSAGFNVEYGVPLAPRREVR